jgi:histidine triad (HIT) family protein
MENCIFCKIVAGEIPAHKVYEDADFLAFLDIHPRSPGHVQIIPKAHHRWVWDVPMPGRYFEIAQKIALAARAAFGTDSVWSRIMGDEVPHAHIWVFPNPQEAKGDPANFEVNAQLLRKALEGATV